MILLLIHLSLSTWAGADSSSKSFDQWKNQYINRAARRGIPKNFSSKLLKDVELDPSVLEKSKNQVILDKNTDYDSFIKGWLGEDSKRIRIGREMLEKHRMLLEKIEKSYQVDREVIVALWGVESYYGRIMGDYDLIRTLATLAYGSGRKRFFEIELNAAFRLLLQGHVSREYLKGSWAGATGQCQLMPSNFNSKARDFDEDGKKDIWTNPGDTFATIAHFMKKVGWKKGKSIGSLAISDKPHMAVEGRYYSKKKFQELGFKSWDGAELDGNWEKRRFSRIPLKNSPVVLRGSNYAPIMVWNRSSLFAAFNILLIEGFQKE